MFIGTVNDIPSVENVRNTVKSGGHMSDKINKKCLSELYKITGFTNWLSWRNLNPVSNNKAVTTTPLDGQFVKVRNLNSRTWEWDHSELNGITKTLTLCRNDIKFSRI